MGLVATAPIRSREPVPEFPMSSTSSGSRKPPIPTPWTRHSPSPVARDPGPQRLDRRRGAQNVIAFQKPGNPRLADAECPHDKRAVRDRFVAGSRDLAGQRTGLRGTKNGHEYLWESLAE